MRPTRPAENVVKHASSLGPADCLQAVLPKSFSASATDLHLHLVQHSHLAQHGTHKLIIRDPQSFYSSLTRWMTTTSIWHHELTR